MLIVLVPIGDRRSKECLFTWLQMTKGGTGYHYLTRCGFATGFYTKYWEHERRPDANVHLPYWFYMIEGVFNIAVSTFTKIWFCKWKNSHRESFFHFNYQKSMLEKFFLCVLNQIKKFFFFESLTFIFSREISTHFSLQLYGQSL